jgi:hypothetical protein
MEWEIGIGAAEAGDKIIFEPADCTFGSVASMDAGGTSWKSMRLSCVVSGRQRLRCGGVGGRGASQPR